MSFEAETLAIETRFEAQWGTTTPYRHDNVDYTPVSEITFVELEIHNGQGRRINIGDADKLYRYPGIISINIHGAKSKGTRALKALADTAAAIFQGVQFSGIICYTSGITRIGEIDGRFVYNVSTPFTRDESF